MNHGCWDLQLREERRARQAVAAADAKRTLKKETGWMQRQPKARSTKSTARIKQFYELTAKARDVPQAEVSVDFDNETKMKRQVRAQATWCQHLLCQQSLIVVLMVPSVAESVLQGRKVMELKGASFSIGSKEIIR